MKKILQITFLLVGGMSMLLMSFHYLQSNSTGILQNKAIAASFWYLLTFRLHILFGIIAILIGPFQFLKGLRTKYLILHRAFGYVYFSSVLLSGLAGLVVAQFAMGGQLTAVGFTMLSILWLYTTIKAVGAIKNGNIAKHKKWMFLSYALTFSAITQRTTLLIPLLTDVPFIPVYQASAWFPWMFNLSIAYALYQRSANVQAEV